MKKYSYLAGAAFLAIASSSSFAAITLQVTTVAINTTLSNNGWVGYELTLVGAAGSQVDAVDFHNVVTAQAGMPQSNIGISGDIFQGFIINNQAWVAGGEVGTPARNPTPLVAAIPGTQTARKDSFWIGTIAPTPSPTWNSIPNISEDNDFSNGANPPYTQSPIADAAGTIGSSTNNTSNGTDYGVGSLMTIAGAYITPFSTTENLAFIIVPSSINTTINGVAVDQNAVDYAITTVLGGGVTVPEPASVGLVGLGAMALLARRRRKV